MKIKVKSNYPPALYQLPGRPPMVTGTLANGSNTVPDGTTLADIEWIRPKLSKVAKAKTVTVKGSRPGVTYTLTQQPTGRWSCTCPAYTFRRTCKHASAM